MKLKEALELGLILSAIGAGSAGLVLYPQYLDKLHEKNWLGKQYVKPSECSQPSMKDLDGDGEYETVMRIRDKKYVLEWNEGEPLLLEARLKLERYHPATPMQINIKVERNDWGKFKNEKKF